MFTWLFVSLAGHGAQHGSQLLGPLRGSQLRRDPSGRSSRSSRMARTLRVHQPSNRLREARCGRVAQEQRRSSAEGAPASAGARSGVYTSAAQLT